MAYKYKEIAKLMEDYGFRLKRQNKHLVWEKNGFTVVTAVTCSDHRGIKNIERVVKKVNGKINDPKTTP